MKLEEVRLIRQKLEEILKEEEKLTNMYFDMTIIASQAGAEKTYQDMTDIGERLGAHQNKTKQLIARFKAEDTRIRKSMEAQGGEKKPPVRIVPLPGTILGFGIRRSGYHG